MLLTEYRTIEAIWRERWHREYILQHRKSVTSFAISTDTSTNFRRVAVQQNNPFYLAIPRYVLSTVLWHHKCTKTIRPSRRADQLQGHRRRGYDAIGVGLY